MSYADQESSGERERALLRCNLEYIIRQLDGIQTETLAVKKKVNAKSCFADFARPIQSIQDLQKFLFVFLGKVKE